LYQPPHGEVAGDQSLTDIKLPQFVAQVNGTSLTMTYENWFVLRASDGSAWARVGPDAWLETVDHTPTLRFNLGWITNKSARYLVFRRGRWFWCKKKGAWVDGPFTTWQGGLMTLCFEGPKSSTLIDETTTFKLKLVPRKKVCTEFTQTLAGESVGKALRSEPDFICLKDSRDRDFYHAKGPGYMIDHTADVMEKEDLLEHKLEVHKVTIELAARAQRFREDNSWRKWILGFDDPEWKAAAEKDEYQDDLTGLPQPIEIFEGMGFGQDRELPWEPLHSTLPLAAGYVE